MKLEFSKHAPVSAAIVFSLVYGALVYYLFFGAPANYPQNLIVEIEKGENLGEISNKLHQEGVISSATRFSFLVRTLGLSGSIKAGLYKFHRPEGMFSIISRISSGDHGVSPLRITLHEGLTVEDMATVLGSVLDNFDEEEFKKRAEDLEGYLFPDTYLFLPNTTPEEVINEMRENFEEKTRELFDSYDNPFVTDHEILTMASIIEREARDPEDRRLISGVLWNRIEIGMPLQVDAVFEYIIDKNTFEVTLEDLKVDSPYNTYRYKGLPPGPIANPSLDSIEAAMYPTENDYLFYLADHSGVTHFSKTFEEHVIKKNKYLN